MTIVTTYEDACIVAEKLLHADVIAIDYETDGLNYKTANIHGTALAVGQDAWYVTNGIDQFLTPVLQKAVQKALVVGHNLTFDLHFMWRRGIYPKRIADTMMAQFLIDENQSLGLKSLAHTKLGYDNLPEFKSMLKDAKKALKAKRLDQVSIDNIPLEQIGEYAVRDAKLTMELWDKSQYELERQGMTKLFWDIEMPFLHVITDMEESGFHIDQTLLNELEEEFTMLRDDALSTFSNISGGVNPASPLQLSQYFFETLGLTPTVFTDKGKPSVDALVLSRLKHTDTTGAAKALSEFRLYSKLLSTYITSFRERLIDGYLYGHFNQLGEGSTNSRLPRTGRLSSADPNLMNIPSRGDIGARIRELFSAPPGYTMLDIDYSQLEMRILAHYTRDTQMLNMFRNNGDPHQLTADLCNVPRYVAKSLNFGVAYGAGPRKFADVIEMSGNPRPSDKEAKEYLNKFALAYPTIAEWKQRVVEYARTLGYVRTIAGRKRRLPDLNERDRSLRATAERQAVNTIIQGSAADIIKWAMIQIYPHQERLGAKMVAQVHDEIVFRAPLETVDELATIAQREMEGAGKHYDLRVNLIAEPGTGENWARAH